jgi:hypothetical protein
MAVTEVIASDPIIDEAAPEAAVQPEVREPENVRSAEVLQGDSQSTDEPQEARAPAKPKRRSNVAALAPASLTVVVYPWGDVWINGKARGSAPLKNVSLKPGRYRISAGQGKPTVTQTVRLRSGEKKKLKLDVTK